MAETETIDTILEATDRLTVDWNALPSGYGEAKRFSIDKPTPVVAQITWVDTPAGETYFWHGLYTVGKGATEKYQEHYAALQTHLNHTSVKILTLKPYLERSYRARFAIAQMALECGAMINPYPKEDRFTTPEGNALKAAFEELKQKGIQGYLSYDHPDLVDQIPAQIGLGRVKDVEFLTRATFV